jgi:uncharacterized membrane protein YozB (DUF420 family)
MSVTDLPHVNATLNGLSSILLLAGFIAIKAKRIRIHRAFMVSALASSTLFLICYVIYHYHAGRTEFRDPAWLRPYYLVLLLTHTLLAVAIVPMVLVTVTRALRRDFERHRRLARWTWPVWMYVSVTGVLIYFLLYHWFPQGKVSGEPGGGSAGPLRAVVTE